MSRVEDTSIQLCRLCLRNTTGCVSMFSEYFYEDVFNLPRIVKNCVGVEVTQKDEFTRMICGLCHRMVVKFHDFKSMCLESQWRLRNMPEWASKGPRDPLGDVPADVPTKESARDKNNTSNKENKEAVDSGRCEREVKQKSRPVAKDGKVSVGGGARVWPVAVWTLSEGCWRSSTCNMEETIVSDLLDDGEVSIEGELLPTAHRQQCAPSGSDDASGRSSPPDVQILEPAHDDHTYSTPPLGNDPLQLCSVVMDECEDGEETVNLGQESAADIGKVGLKPEPTTLPSRRQGKRPPPPGRDASTLAQNEKALPTRFVVDEGQFPPTNGLLTKAATDKELLKLLSIAQLSPVTRVNQSVREKVGGLQSVPRKNKRVLSAREKERHCPASPRQRAATQSMLDMCSLVPTKSGYQVLIKDGKYGPLGRKRPMCPLVPSRKDGSQVSAPVMEKRPRLTVDEKVVQVPPQPLPLPSIDQKTGPDTAAQASDRRTPSGSYRHHTFYVRQRTILPKPNGTSEPKFIKGRVLSAHLHNGKIELKNDLSDSVRRIIIKRNSVPGGSEKHIPLVKGAKLTADMTIPPNAKCSLLKVKRVCR